MQEIREIVINVYFTFLYLITYGILGSTSDEAQRLDKKQVSLMTNSRILTKFANKDDRIR